MHTKLFWLWVTFTPLSKIRLGSQIVDGCAQDLLLQVYSLLSLAWPKAPWNRHGNAASPRDSGSGHPCFPGPCSLILSKAVSSSTSVPA